MNRRKFFINSSIFTLGATLFNPLSGQVSQTTTQKGGGKKAKNIIMLVSDGMSIGTLNMADILLNRKTGKGTNWLQAYKDNIVSRGLMDMASASSIVTDSAAASSSWGGGFRVNNGSLNIGVNGEEYLPLWQKFKKVGKMAGCVTTVPITHATPAGFCVNQKSRNGQEDIAIQYIDLRFDIMMGGGNNYFSPEYRKDKQDIYTQYKQKGFNVVKNRDEMLSVSMDKPILGVFYNDGLPYSLDREQSAELKKTIPTLAEMTKKAIDKMKNHSNGFVLQVEGGKVDWAAHANDVGALLYDQIAFDDAVKVALDFAKQDGNTLVVITTDHGNANPGVIYGKNANSNFDNIQQFKQTNDWVLNSIDTNTTVSQVKEKIEYANGKTITDEQAKQILGYYTGDLTKEDGVYNPKHLPFKILAEMQKEYTSVGWISMDHSADYTELAMYGPGSESLVPFIKNTDLHYFLLNAAEVENKF